MAVEPAKPIVSEAEIAAALSEARQQSADIPSLEQGGPAIVPVPVETPALLPPRQPAKPPPTAVAAKTAPPPAATAEPDGALPLALRILDRILWVLNWPFARLSAKARRTIGVLAAMTLVFSITAGVLIPRLRPPPHDPQQLYRLTPPPKPPPPEEAKAEGHGAATEGEKGAAEHGAPAEHAAPPAEHGAPAEHH
jgi:hypothetical protein